MSEVEPRQAAVDHIVDEIKKADENYKGWRSGADKLTTYGAGFLGGAAITLATGDAWIGGAMGAVGIGFLGGAKYNLDGAAHVSRYRASLTQALAQHELATGEIVEVYPEAEEEQAGSEAAQVYDQGKPAEA